MKIWIRSQDKKQLFEAKEVYIREERLLIDKDAHYNSVYRIISLVSETFNVSEQAAYLRLCDLGYIRPPQDDSAYRQLSLL